MKYRDRANRILEEARFYIDNRSTMRATAKAFDISKSTVHKDLTKNLWDISPILSRQVQLIIEFNIKERSYRGGNAAREKFLKNK